MKKLFILSIAVAFSSISFLHSKEVRDEKIGNISVLVTGLKAQTGTVKIGLANSKETYKSKNKTFKGATVEVNGGKVAYVFTDLPHGEYAVRLYHDANGNGKFDTNVFGYPKENFGFSNNAKVRFGPPKYKKVKFELASENKEIVIQLQ